MKKYLALLGAFACLTSCEQRSSDDYRFDRKEYDRSTVHLTVVEHPSLADLQREAKVEGADVGDRELMAFGKVEKVGTGCTIHIVDPAVRYAPEWVGHEVVHCIHGRWHR